jgi:NAD(P)-dependent dehydrogenase (short-subunit alcohol dehydrogenase family)
LSKILVTGGAGFIGSNFVRMLLLGSDHQVVNVDALTYAGNLENLKDVEKHARNTFVKGDIADPVAMEAVFAEHRPDVVVHFAAESHVDRSVLDATAFVRTNVTGTQVLLDKSRIYKVQRNPMTEAAIDAGVTRDLYVSLGEPLDDGAWVVRVYHKPFIDWIWGGAFLMALGGLLAVCDRRYRVRVRTRAAAATPASGPRPGAGTGVSADVPMPGLAAAGAQSPLAAGAPLARSAVSAADRT